MWRADLVAVVVAAILLCDTALAKPKLITADEGPVYAVPENSGLRFVRFEEPFRSAVFQGRTMLSGTYYFGRISTDRADTTIALYFVPDPADAARLPYWHEE